MFIFIKKGKLMIRTLLLTIVSVLAVSGQVKVLKYNPHCSSPSGKEFDILLPFFTSANNSVSQRMNEFFYQSRFEHRPPQSVAQKIPELVKYSTAYESSFKVNRNDSSILSFSFYSFGCGASCSSGREYYNFDPMTGRSITIYDLLSEKGEKLLAARLQPYWEQCIDSVKEERHYEEHDVKSFPYIADAFSTLDSQLILFKSSGGQDNDTPFSIAYSFNSLKPYLSNYGRKILLNEKNHVKQPNKLLQQIFYGTIGTSKITVVFEYLYKNRVNGFYYYQKYGEHILLEQDDSHKTLRNGETIILHDGNGLGETISAKITPTGLVGTWKSKGKTLPFKVSLE